MGRRVRGQIDRVQVRGRAAWATPKPRQLPRIYRFDRESTTYKVEISVSRRFPSSIKYAITPSSDGGPYKRQWNLSGITPQEFSFRAENFIRNYSLTEAK